MHLLFAFLSSLVLVVAAASSSSSEAKSSAASSEDDDSSCGGPAVDCLKACRSCKLCDIHNEGDPNPDGSSPFVVGSNRPGDCKQLVCRNPNATLVVDGHSFPSLVCFQGKWHFGFPDYLEETESAACLTPPALGCDPDASVVYDSDGFECQCNAGFDDQSSLVLGYGSGQVCSQCSRKRINVIFLLDYSGSMADSWSDVKEFAKLVIKFLQVSAAGNQVAIVTSATTWTVVSPWGDDDANEETLTGLIDDLSTPDGLSNLGSGLEAVKAALIQPETDRSSVENKLVVVTDGAVKISDPCFADVPKAVKKLDSLGVEIIAVGTRSEYSDALEVIANNIDQNVVIPNANATNYAADLANRVQKLLCA